MIYHMYNWTKHKLLISRRLQCARVLPEVEILRHINLFEDIKQALFLCGPLYFVIEWNCHDVRIFAVIQIMAAKQSYDRTFRDDDHVPACCEPHESY